MMKEKRGIVNQQNTGLFLFVTPFLAFIGPYTRKYYGYALSKENAEQILKGLSPIK